MVIRRQIDAPVPRLDAEVLIGGRLGPGRGGRHADVRAAGAARRVGRRCRCSRRTPRSSPGGTARRPSASPTTRSACSPTAGSPTSCAGRRPGRRAAAAGDRLRAGRHRPGLDAASPAGAPPWRRRSTARTTAPTVGTCRRRRRRPVRAAAGRLALVAARLLRPGRTRRRGAPRSTKVAHRLRRRCQRSAPTSDGGRLILRREGQPDSIAPFPERVAG